MSQFITTYYPNRTKSRQGTTGVNNKWQMVASDGTFYDNYAALLAAGKTAWPGSPSDFPQGVPAMNIRTTAASGLADGSPVLVKTNTTMTPADDHDVDFVVSGSGQQVSPPGGIKTLWLRQTVGGDYTIFTGLF